MYDLPYYNEKNQDNLNSFIARYPFALLTGCDASNAPVATQIPVFVEEVAGRRVLRGHLMKHTDHHKAFLQNQKVLVVFTGHHTYVSGRWYTNPHTPSTWNYMSVHVRGNIRFLEDQALIEVLRMTSPHFENYDNKSPTVYDNLPSEHTQKLMKAIVAFEIEIEAMDSVFKLSQDRDKNSYDNIIKNLKQEGESGQVIASEMAKRRGEVFPEA